MFKNYAEKLLKDVFRTLISLALDGNYPHLLSDGADATAGDLNVFQLIQSHQEKAFRLALVEEIRTVPDCSLHGMLFYFLVDFIMH
ncbi:hypothetical protein RHMOL_Rhmol03G0241900 [Rhododendron molle]|uniref:Uncharacterized protein n=1 Tax=Rhododendron molle TaxID=49168 RepID=A0ACC0PKE0_RHOML|nr:hypothetical protein RHMOL_Rhmol03G0241900 [Rhododendron molle]